FNKMDQGTQPNAAMVEAATAAAHNLATEADALFQLLGQFNIGGAVAPKRVSQPAGAAPRAQPTPAPARQMSAKVGKS
ncbi:methyl-accepting chemotaxis protein, partial [Rhizobium ruizarguesonis]